MKVTYTTKTLEQLDAKLIVVPYRTGGKNRVFQFLDKKCKKALSEIAGQEHFNGESDRTLIWQGNLFERNLKIIAVGCGKDKSAHRYRTAVGRGIRYAHGHRIDKIALFFDARDFGPAHNTTAWSAEGLIMSAYRFNIYKTGSQTQFPKEAVVGCLPAVEEKTMATKALKQGKHRADAVSLARDLVNEPANVLSPVELATRATEMAAKKSLDIIVLNDKEIRKNKMNLLLAVAAGSTRPPSFIHTIYRPKGKPTKRVVLVGKGVTFDSGGLCIKPGKSMYEMKTDMAGAAAVLGIMSSLKALDVTAEVHGIIPATDNAVNGDATRPGDVITARSGKTVEILNTDAEGRLILADALAYGVELKPNIIIDFATLTGACEVALGSFTAGLFSTSDKEASEILKAADAAGERLWRLPLAKELASSIRSDIADIKNIGSRFGGAITAALFLKHFSDNCPWAHLDIAGPARLDKATPLCPKGGSGYGVLTGLAYLEALRVK